MDATRTKQTTFKGGHIQNQHYVPQSYIWSLQNVCYLYIVLGFFGHMSLGSTLIIGGTWVWCFVMI